LGWLINLSRSSATQTTARQIDMANLFVLAAFIAAVLFAWLSLRLRGNKNIYLRWIGTGLTGFAALAFTLIGVIAAAGLYKERFSRSAPVPELRVEGSVEQIRRGQAIAGGFCDACHSPSGTLTGGEDIGKHLPLDMGSFVSSNLTAAGALKRWSDGQIFRAIRNGVDADGRRLVIMSLTNAGKLSDDDIRALIAYIRSQPPAGTATPEPPDQFNLVGLLLLGSGQFPAGKPVSTAAILAPPKAETITYGEYVLSYQDCRECHGQQLTGGVQGQWAPIGPGLSLVADWTREQFIATLRTGKDPSGHELGERMPWRPLGKMDDVELGAIYEYLTHLTDAGKAEAK
jgi:mono/diheme cytochrome c family protein